MVRPYNIGAVGMSQAVATTIKHGGDEAVTETIIALPANVLVRNVITHVATAFDKGTINVGYGTNVNEFVSDTDAVAAEETKNVEVHEILEEAKEIKVRFKPDAVDEATTGEATVIVEFIRL